MDRTTPRTPDDARTCGICDVAVDVAPLVVVWQGVTLAHDVCPRHVADQLRRIAATTGPERSPSAVLAQAGRRLARDEDLEQIRSWALSCGLPAARTGGLSSAVMAAWRDRPAAGLEHIG